MNIFRVAATITAIVVWIGSAANATPPPVLTLKCVASSSVCPSTGADYLWGTGATSLGGAALVSVQGYYAPGDGGGGDFYLYDAAHACSADDGGTILTNASACYHRRFTGTVYMPWFGVLNADFASGMPNDVATACPSTTNCFLKAFTAAATANGNNVVSTGGMYLFSSAPVTPPFPNQTLTCDASFTGATASSHYYSSADVRGAIVLGHSASIRFTNNNNEFHHCVVLTNGGGTGGVPIKLNPGSQREALDNDANMIANGDVGVFCDNPENNYIHDVAVIGFDTGVAAWGCSRFTMDHVYIDADVGVYLQGLKSPAFMTNIKVKNFLSQAVSNDDLPFAVTGIVDDVADGGLCQVTIDSLNPASSLQAGDWVSLSSKQISTVSGPVTSAQKGPLSCYGTFQVYSVDGSHLIINLKGTKWGNSSSPFLANVPASWLNNSSIINVSSVDGMQAGQCIRATDSGDSALTDPTYTCTDSSGTHTNYVMVKDVSYYSKKIVIAKGDGTPAYTKSASTNASTLSFSNYGTYPTTAGVGVGVLYLYASSHIAAGNSIGGAAAGNVATSVMAGGPGDTSTLGFMGNNFFTFAHRNQFNFASAGPALCDSCAYDSQSELFDIKQIGLKFGQKNSPLPLTASVVHGNTTITSLRLGGSGTPADPAYSGWRKPDAVLSLSGAINGQTISHAVNEGDLTLTLSSGPTGTTDYPNDTIYDVNPYILTGTTTTGSETITGLNHDPTAGATPWHVGDTILTPVNPTTGVVDFPYGAKIVSLIGAPTPSVTLDTASAGTSTGITVADGTPPANVNVSTISADFVGSNLGGGGGIVLNAGGAGCNSVQGVIVNPNNLGQPAVEAVDGCNMLTNVSTAQPNDFMIDANAANVLMSGSRTTNAGIYSEGPLASNAFAGSGNLMGGGGQSNITTFGDTSTCPPTSQTTIVVFCGGDQLGGTIKGNTYKQCNPSYQSNGCVTTSIDRNGVWKHLNSATTPIFEYNDNVGAVLAVSYQDGIQAKHFSIAKTVLALENIVSSCGNTGCASDGVLLPLSSNWIDTGGGAYTGPSCLVTGNCGVAGAITIYNSTPNTITVWCTGSGTPPDTVNGIACTTGDSLLSNKLKTYYPIQGVGWVSN